MLGYRQLSLGHQVIDLRRVIIDGGEDDRSRPRLAIARADEKTIHMTRSRDGSLTFRGGVQRVGHSDPRTNRNIELPAGTLPTVWDLTPLEQAVLGMRSS